MINFTKDTIHGLVHVTRNTVLAEINAPHVMVCVFTFTIHPQDVYKTWQHSHYNSAKYQNQTNAGVSSYFTLIMCGSLLSCIVKYENDSLFGLAVCMSVCYHNIHNHKLKTPVVLNTKIRECKKFKQLVLSNSYGQVSS